MKTIAVTVEPDRNLGATARMMMRMEDVCEFGLTTLDRVSPFRLMNLASYAAVTYLNARFRYHQLPPTERTGFATFFNAREVNAARRFSAMIAMKSETLFGKRFRERDEDLRDAEDRIQFNLPEGHQAFAPASETYLFTVGRRVPRAYGRGEVVVLADGLVVGVVRPRLGPQITWFK